MPLRNLHHLSELGLGGNQIFDLLPLTNLRYLLSLDLHANNVFDLSALADLKYLTTLNLNRNRVSDLSPLANLRNLTSLDLSNNKVADLTPLANLRNLSSLDLGENNVFDLSPLAGMQSLISLSLQENQVADLSAIAGLKNLTSLDLQVNQVSDLSALVGLQNLTSLYLYSNKVSDLSVFRGLEKLTTLYLPENQVSDLTPLANLENLTSLELSNNEVSDLTPLANLKNLTSLDLYNNRISDLAPLQGLKQLKKLHLQNNKITHIPEPFLQSGLEWDIEHASSRWGGDKIYLHGNSLEAPPPEIIEKGREAIKNYFKALVGSQEIPINEIKILMVGDGGSGKTSLVKRIIHNTFNEHENKTDGIDIHPWTVNLHNKKISANLWDFGGQEIYHATHQFFLSKRSLYILVLDGRKDEKTEYWLKLIESFGGNSPVLVVLNKIDKNPNFQVNGKFLKNKYPHILDFCRLSCKSEEGLAPFCTALKSTLAKVEILQTTWPKNWFNVKEHLENMKEHYISYDRYRDICEKENIMDELSRETLVAFLNDLGVLLYFKDFELDDTQVLKPQWVTEAVYKIINSKELADGRGSLKLEMLNNILRKRKQDTFFYPQEKRRYIIGLMKKFELCYPLEPDGVLVPGHLDTEEPDFDFNYHDALKFILQYDFLPRSVMPRFIVRCHRDIKDGLQWRSGVVLEDKSLNAMAAVKVDEEAEKIFIWVSGELRRDYFSILRKTLRDINRIYEKLAVKELVPLPDFPETTIDYNDLIGQELMNKDEITVGRLRKSYSVSGLLSGIVDQEELVRDLELRARLDALKELNENSKVASRGDTYINVTQVAAIKPEVEQEVEVNRENCRPVMLSDPAYANMQKELNLHRRIKDVKVNLEQEEKVKRICDDLAKKANRKLARILGTGFLLVAGLWFVLIKLFTWEKMEMWTFLVGPILIAALLFIYSIRGKKYKTESFLEEHLDDELIKLYDLNRFDSVKHKQLKEELTDLEKQLRECEGKSGQ